jgi:hypothetical protein
LALSASSEAQTQLHRFSQKWLIVQQLVLRLLVFIYFSVSVVDEKYKGIAACLNKNWLL